jgi:hypothetical protein
MNDAYETMPSLDAALGGEGWRARGIRSWEDTANLGRANLRSLKEWAQEAANKAFVEQDREFLTEVRPTLARLMDLAAHATEDKPLLPHLRRESFHLNEPVRVYVGELPGATASWAQGRVSAIEKAFNPDWKGPGPNSGYYWRVTARLAADALPQFSELSFSTSEPRVLPEADFIWLRGALLSDRRFVEIFAENSRRGWQPLWCQEAGVSIDAAAMNLIAWLDSD